MFANTQLNFALVLADLKHRLRLIFTGRDITDEEEPQLDELEGL